MMKKRNILWATLALSACLLSSCGEAGFVDPGGNAPGGSGGMRPGGRQGDAADVF